MGMTRSLTTAYHPQADGQTEGLNQLLEIYLQAYVGPSRDDWASYLDVLALSYNLTPHTATGYAPAYLLQGYTPITGSTILHSPSSIDRPFKNPSQTKLRCGTILTKFYDQKLWKWLNNSLLSITKHRKP